MVALDFLAPVQADMAALDAFIVDNLNSDVVIIEQMGRHIVGSGGKRLRPAITLLTGRAIAPDAPAQTTMAAVVEFIHTATLLHDDVVDNSGMRRGQQTANALWGNAASVLTGDFLYSRAFELMVTLNHMGVLQILARTTNRIAEGEVMQLMLSHQADITEQTYLEVCRRKTAVLFEAAVECASLLAGASAEQARRYAEYGDQLGLAFQLADDSLDYTASAGEMGKDPGDDLAEGKYTLPLIHALRELPEKRRDTLIASIEKQGREAWAEAQAAIAETGGIAYTARRAEEAASRAAQIAEGFPQGAAREALIELAHFAARRKA
nr:polyprenyl synthetase family protein [Oceanococcus sp. HetDA_MAG_MS8]